MVNQRGSQKDNISEKSNIALKIRGDFSCGWDKQKEKEEKQNQTKEDKEKEAKAKKDDDAANELKEVSSKLLAELEDELENEKSEKKKANTFENILSLKDIDLEIKKGEFVCIIGDTGSGKTTLLNTIIGATLYVPKNEIESVGGYDKELTPENLNGITDNLQDTEIKPEEAPIQLNGSISFVE